MNLNQMVYFVTIVENKFNLSRSSEKLHISQPGLSKFVNSYESENNVRLFERKKNKLVGLTDTGQIVYQITKNILNKSEELERVIKADQANMSVSIKFGLQSMVLRLYLSKFLPEFRKQFPEVTLNIQELGSELAETMLVNNELDIAFLVSPKEVSSDKYIIESLQKYELVVFLDPKHPLANYKSLEWVDLKGYPLAAINQGYSISKIVKDGYKSHGMNYNPMIESATWEYLCQASHDTQMISILPSVLEQMESTENLVMIPFAEPVTFDLTLCANKKTLRDKKKALFFNEILNIF